MILYEDEFIKQFTGGEIRKISVNIRKVNTDIYLRRLSGYVTSALKKKADQAIQRGTLDAIIGVVNKSDLNYRDDDIELVDFFLLRKSVCDAEGKLIFDNNDEFFQQWLTRVDGDVMEFVLSEVAKFNKFIPDDEESNEVKKK